MCLSWQKSLYSADMSFLVQIFKKLLETDNLYLKMIYCYFAKSFKKKNSENNMMKSNLLLK